MVVPPESMHLTNTSRQWPPNSCPNKTWEADTQGRSFVTLYNEIYHTPQQVSTGHQDQAVAVFMEERKWCIKEIATSTPFKETQDLSFKSREKSSFKKVAPSSNATNAADYESGSYL